MELSRSDSSFSCIRPPSSLLIERPVEPDDVQDEEKCFDLPDVFSPTPEDASPILPKVIIQHEKKNFESVAVFSPSPDAAAPISPEIVVRNEENPFTLPDVFSPTPEAASPILPKNIAQNEENRLDLPVVFSSSPEAASPGQPTTTHHLPSSSSHQVSSIEIISTPSILRDFKSGELERRGAPAREVLRNQFDGPRPVGDPSILSRKYDLIFPPVSLHAYPNVDKFPFSFVESSKPVEVSDPMDGYVEQSDKLSNFLSAQTKKHAKDYAAYSRQRDKLTAAWDRTNDSRYAKAERESRKTGHNIAIGKHKIIEPLTRNQQLEISELETDLAPLLKKVELTRAETEGTIAAAFMFHWDHADQVPTEHQLSVLREIKGFEKFVGEKKKEKSENKYGLEYTLTDADLHGHAVSRNPNKPLFDDIRVERKKVYRDTLIKQRQEYNPPSPPLCSLPEPVNAPWEAFLNPGTKTMAKKEDHQDSPSMPVPEWFPSFVKYNIVKFESLKIHDQLDEFLRIIRKLESRINNPDTHARFKWDMEWHHPSPAWDAPVGERLCRQCHGGRQKAAAEPQGKKLEEDVALEGDFDFADVFETSWDAGKPATEDDEALLREIRVGVKKAMVKVGKMKAEKAPARSARA
ncbi:hypothetical protein ACHAPT_005060 [Fusarium lateritium]